MKITRSKTLRFGIVGCGVVAPTHAVALNQIDGADLVAVADVSASRVGNFAKEFSVRQAHTDYRKLIEDPDIDAVCVCTPHYLHAQIAQEAAQAGKHVLVEKPMATTLEAADQLIEACEQNGVTLGVVFQHRFDPAARYVKRLIEDGALGKVALASVYVKWFRTQDYYGDGSWRGTWQYAGGGALINQAIHAIDVLCWLMGDATRVTGYYDTVTHDIEVEDTAAAAVRFANGALGVIEASTTTYPQTAERLELAGSRGTVTIEGGLIARHELAGHSADSPNLDAGDHRFHGKTYYGTSHPRLLEDFVAALREGRSPVVDGREGRKALEVITGIYESSRTGAEVIFRPNGSAS